MGIEDSSRSAGEKENPNPIFASHLQMEGIIQELQQRSEKKYQFGRTTLNLLEGTGILSSPDRKLQGLSIERINKRDDPKIKDIYEFILNFDPEESDTLRVIQGVVAKPKYDYRIIEQSYKDNQGTERKRIVAHMQSSYLELLGQKDQIPKEAILYSGYIFNIEDLRRRGLGTELQQTVFRWALEKARAQLQNLKAIILEGKSASEAFWNTIGLKRLYYEDEEGNYQEVPYIQPPVQWDPKSGIPLDPQTGMLGKDEKIRDYAIPEHLMIRMINGASELSTEELLTMVATIFEDNYKLERYEEETYPTDEIINLTREKIKIFWHDLHEKIRNTKDKKIFLMSAEERERKREKLESNGKKLIEHTTWSELRKDAINT